MKNPQSQLASILSGLAKIVAQVETLGADLEEMAVSDKAAPEQATPEKATPEKAKVSQLKKGASAAKKEVKAKEIVADKIPEKVAEKIAEKTAEKIAEKTAEEASEKAPEKSQTVLDQVYDVICKSRKGASIDKLREKTKLDPRQLSNALYKLTRKGIVEARTRGIYFKKK